MKQSLIETKDVDGQKKKSFEIMKGKDGNVYQIKGVSTDNKNDTFHVKERMIHKGINQHRTFKIKSSDLQNIIKESSRKIYSKDVNKQKNIDIIKDSEQYPKVIKCPCKSKKLYRYTPGLIDQSIYKVIKIKSKKQADKIIKPQINTEKVIKIGKLKESEKHYNTDNRSTNESNIKKTNKVISKKIERIINKDNIKEKSEDKIKEANKVRVKNTSKVIPKKTEKKNDKVTTKKIEKKNNTIKEKNENKVTEKVYEEAKIEKKKYQKKSKKINEDKNKESSKIIEKKEAKKSLKNKKITKKDINHIKEIIEAKKDNSKMK
jgi:hypothetical protein